MRRYIGPIVVVLLLLGTNAFADTIYLKGGGVMRGEVLSIGEDALLLSLDGLDGATVKLPLSRISDFGLYEIKRARIDENSAEDREELGDWTLSRGMFAFAMDEYKAGIGLLEEDLAVGLRRKFAEASSRCGADKFARGEALISKGKLREARAFFRNIIDEHPTCPAASAARGRITIFDAEIRLQRELESAAFEKQLTRDGVRDRLKTVNELIDKGDRMRRLGLRDSGSLGRAENAFQAAVNAYEQARKILDDSMNTRAVKTKNQVMRDLHATVLRKLGDAYVDLGHNYVVKGTILRANHYMGLALALDPNNPKAHALRQSISAASSNSNWGRPTRSK